MGYTYILQCSDRSYYVGSTNDVERRLLEHSNGKSRSTKHKLPVKLVYKKSFDTLAESRGFEYFIKRQRNKAFYQKLIDGAFV